MLKSVGVGTEYFHELIENDCYYVDKTSFIRTVFQDNGAKVMLITRPRRFGKTLTMSTFCDFLSLDPENPGDVSRQEKWFKDTEIMKDKDFCNRYMGKFPVIFISLKSVDGDDFKTAYEQLGSTVFKMYNTFSYLADSSKLTSTEIKTYKAVADDEDYICDIKNKNKVINSLQNLTMLLYKHHGIKPIVLIDEYDVPVAKAAHNEYYKDMISVIRLFLGNALKTNLYLGRAVLTGCLRPPRESIFSGFNNYFHCSVLNGGDDDISGGMGFTEEETRKVLSDFGLSEYHEEVRRKYGGRNFGYVQVYSPRDVMSFCEDRQKKLSDSNNFNPADDYRPGSDTDDVIKELMEFIRWDDVDKLQSLMDGESIITRINETLCYSDLKKHYTEDFWSMLLYSGYLTFDPEYRSEDICEHRLYIPNEKIRECFKSRINDFFSNNQEMKNYTSDFVNGLFNGDSETVENSLNRLLAKYVSIRDLSTKAPKENCYHGFINGLLINSGSLIEEQKSNLESGNGYVDLIIKPKKPNGSIVILELKQTSDEDVDKSKVAAEAIEQIIRKKYAEPYISRNDTKAILIYGICFCRKECSVVSKKLK